jgi:hypothetical protein
MAEHYYTVGKHGAPTPETAPHGYKWRLDGPWICSGGPYEWHPENQWWPLPAPPIEEAPAPEPVARWTHDRGWIKYVGTPIPEADVAAAVDALNTLDATGIVWGEPRPMSELPKAGRVLAQYEDSFFTLYAEAARGWGEPLDGWWPLPEVTP